jgi:selenocysteine lyase/cysteine desulfurase
LAQAGLFLSHGNFYAQQLVKGLGHANDGLARAGCAIYSTADEVERLLEEIRCIQHEVESA